MPNTIDILATHDGLSVVTWYDAVEQQFHLDACSDRQQVSISLTHAELRALWQMFLAAFLKAKGI